MNKTILRLLLAIFLVRLALSLLPSFQVDMGAWLAWAERLAALGPAKFYSDEVWTQYTPGFLYWLLIVGKLGWINPLMIKIPVIMADMFTGLLMWKVIKTSNHKLANWVFGLYVLSPVVIMDGSIWGQIDGLLTLTMVGATYLLVEKGKYNLSYIVAGIAFLIKPQMVAILPVLIVVTLARYGLKKTVIATLGAIATTILGYYPFYPANPVAGLVDLMQKMGVSYSFTSLFALNIWSYVGMWIADSTRWLELSYFGWGTMAMAMVFSLLLLRYRRHLKQGREVYLLMALACFTFFLFPTRVHERYLFPMFAFLMTYGGVKKNIYVGGLIVVMMILYTANLYLPYSYYEPVLNPLKNREIENLIFKLIPWIATGQILVFASLWLFPTRQDGKKSVPITVRHREAVEHGGDN